jgi:hypothetical protein
MSAGQATASQWLCDRCGMTTSQQGGEKIDLPANWIQSDDGQFCLACRRERAAEAAIDEAPEHSSHKVRADLRRDAILGFEVTRDPQRPNAEIARACRSSVSAVASTRSRLGLAEAADPVPRARRGT